MGLKYVKRATKQPQTESGTARKVAAEMLAEIEIRQLFEAEDFGAEFTPELRAQEERLRAEIGKR
jgi:hypothetical protein